MSDRIRSLAFLVMLFVGTACQPAAQNATTTPVSTLITPAADTQVTEPILTGGATGIIWLPGERGVVLAGPQQLNILDPDQKGFQPQVEVPVSALASPAMLTVARDEPALAWVNNGVDVFYWNTALAGSPQPALEGQAPVTGVAVQPDGGAVAVSSTDAEIQIVDVSSLQPVQSWQAPSWLSNLSYSPDGGQVGGADLANFKVYVFNASSGEIQQTYEWFGSESPNLYGAYFSPDWGHLAWTARNAVQLMDLPGGENGPLLTHEDAVAAAAWSPDSQLLATAAAATMNAALSPIVVLWDAANGEAVQTIFPPGPVQSLSFSPDGKQLAVLDSSGKLQIWNVSP